MLRDDVKYHCAACGEHLGEGHPNLFAAIRAHRDRCSQQLSMTFCCDTCDQEVVLPAGGRVPHCDETGCPMHQVDTGRVRPAARSRSRREQQLLSGCEIFRDFEHCGKALERNDRSCSRRRHHPGDCLPASGI